MKIKLTVLVLFVSILGIAQQGINYKALIKDDLGNVVANQDIDVQFTILLSGAGLEEIYKEEHTPITDVNGLIMLNIGEGITSLGNFSTLDWHLSGDYILKTEIDTNDDGAFELTTESYFKSVPFAKVADVAKNLSGLEQVTENSNTGWRLINANPEHHGDIGHKAVDLSSQLSGDDTGGATNEFAFASGNGTWARGLSSSAMGSGTTANGDYSFASGAVTIADGDYSAAIGRGLVAAAMSQITLGSFNVDTGASVDGDSNWFSTDHLFVIGNGTSDSDRSNALTILKNGTITAPSLDIAEITDDKALITKEYFDSNDEVPSGLEEIIEEDEDGAFYAGWRLKGVNPNHYGPIGFKSVDLSYNNSDCDNCGATGPFSVALGIGNVASEYNSTAMGIYNIASGKYSTAMGALNSSPGKYSTVMGYRNYALSYVETALGQFNTYYTPANTNGSGDEFWNPTDRLFVLGNGTSLTSRNDALTIYKNGNAKFDAEIQTTTTGDTNMIPIAYGSVSATGSILGGSGNFTVTYNASDTSYTIFVNNQPVTASNSAGIVTVNTSTFRTANTTYDGINMLVHIFLINGNKVQSPFQFVMYKN